MTVKFLVALPTQQHEWLRKQAYERRMSMADIVREAISKNMKEERAMLWKDAVGRTLREVLEATYDKPAEDIFVDNEELEWYQRDLDEMIVEVRKSPEGDAEALITESLAWIDCSTQIRVHDAQEWKAEEGLDWIVMGSRSLEVINPWSGATVSIEPDDVTEERLEAMATIMDDEIREAIHMEIPPCSPFEFFREYVERVGPEEAGKIWFS